MRKHKEMPEAIKKVQRCYRRQSLSLASAKAKCVKAIRGLSDDELFKLMANIPSQR